MVRVRIKKIIWNDEVIEHIKKHSLTKTEVEEVIKSDVYINEGHSGRKKYTSRMGARIITVIGTIDINKLQIVTARDASSDERQEYYEYEENKKRKI